MIFEIPHFIVAPFLAVRSWLRGRERARIIATARAQAIADVDALSEADLRESLRPGRAARGWDGTRHQSAIPEMHRTYYARAYYVASRDHARARLTAITAGK
jgi:hypothetical protein